MSDWKQWLSKAASNVEDYLDTFRFRMKQRFRTVDSVTIQAYNGYGTRTRFVVRGRVLGNYGVTSAEQGDTAVENLKNTVRRLNTHEIPHARIQVDYFGITQTITADEDGFFVTTLTLPTPLDSGGWVDVTLTALDYPEIAEPVTERILVPEDDAQFGVISDLDDTVLQADVLKPVRLVRNVFLENAHTRLPFEGVAAFYQALQRGTTDAENPIFFVSNSPWNLYDFIVEFFEIRGIPTSPLFLVNLGLTESHLLRPSGMKHKLGAIETLFETYPNLNFILIGDSGEHDAEIYLQALKDNPGRVLAIYIRDVTEHRGDSKVQAMIDEAAALGATMLLIPDTAAAAAHAVANGYILPEEEGEVVEEIAESRAGDNG